MAKKEKEVEKERKGEKEKKTEVQYDRELIPPLRKCQEMGGGRNEGSYICPIYHPLSDDIKSQETDRERLLSVISICVHANHDSGRTSAEPTKHRVM